jgi:hypothetical protein
LKHRYEAFLAANDVGVAGIEFISDAAGTAYTYDVNTNTNCNPDAEARAGRSGMTHWPNTWVANSPATRRHCERSEAIPCPTRLRRRYAPRNDKRVEGWTRSIASTS